MMAFDQGLAQRIREEIGDLPGMVEKKMFGGIGFILMGNMACGVSKASLIVRVGLDDYEKTLLKAHTRIFDMKGRATRGWVLVDPPGFEDDNDLSAWLKAAVDFAAGLPPK
jgi:TfoX/Sxy family transcriptional regulator of competence genes